MTLAPLSTIARQLGALCFKFYCDLSVDGATADPQPELGASIQLHLIPAGLDNAQTALAQLWLLNCRLSVLKHTATAHTHSNDHHYNKW